MEKPWSARWISHPKTDPSLASVQIFRKTWEIDHVPDKFLIHVSADERYKLYINNKLIGQGPIRGDLMKWRFETFDISPYLIVGQNVLAAQVWDMQDFAPAAQISGDQGLIIQADHPDQHIINTNHSWKVSLDTAYSFFRIDHLRAYYVVGPGESFDCSSHAWNWRATQYNDYKWVHAEEKGAGMPLKALGKFGGLPGHILHPSDIPIMERQEQFFGSVRRSTMTIDQNKLLSGESNTMVPSNTKTTILLDQRYLTTAYPELSFSGGKGSIIKLTYAESLFETEMKTGKEEFTAHKGNRHQIEGKKIWGNFDLIRPDGGSKRVHETLWWRTFRYVQLDIETMDQPLILHEIKSYFTGYPLEQSSRFITEKAVLDSIYQTGWRTQRLCAGETFFDCPYYEQLQYVGDTRVQGLVTYYSSGDTLLWRKSIQDFYDSRIPVGITQSRYPCKDMQLIPTYSLVWITMLYDYLMHCGDQDFISEKMPLVDDILLWFEANLGDDLLFGKIEGWNFMDWVNYDGWDSGVPPLQGGGKSSVMLLQYLYTIKKAMVLYDHFSDEDAYRKYDKMSREIGEAVQKNYWDSSRKMYADTPDKKYFSQHTNVWAILTDVMPEAGQSALFERIYQNDEIAPCSYYFRFYLADAMKKVGRGDDYLSFLEPWEIMLDNGLTTFAEGPAPSRSDCHAWSSSPLYHFYKIMGGVEPSAAGFKEVAIAPCFGELQYISAILETASGMITLDLAKDSEGRVEGTIRIPEGMEGIFYWNGREKGLKGGENVILKN